MSVMLAWCLRTLVFMGMFLLTYNPFDNASLYYWVFKGDVRLSGKVLIGVVGSMVWIVMLWLSWKNIKLKGFIALLLILAAVVYFLEEHFGGVLRSLYFAYAIASAFFAFAMVWPKIRFAVTGTRQVDDEDSPEDE